MASFERQCDVCGKTYTAHQSNSRYCSGTCRSRASKDPKTLTRRPNRSDGGDVEPASVAALARAVFQDAGLLADPRAAALLAVAARIDDRGESTQATASAVRVFLAGFDVVMKSAKKQSGALDELRQRRQIKIEKQLARVGAAVD